MSEDSRKPKLPGRFVRFNERHPDVGVDREQADDRGAQELDATRVVGEVGLDQPADHDGQAVRFLVLEQHARTRHGMRRTFVARRESNSS